MKRKILFTVFGLLIVGSLAACSAVGSGKVPSRSMTANGTGVVYLTPDVAYISIGVHSESASVGAALTANTNQAQKIRKALNDLGVEDKDIQTSSFNVYPNQTYNPDGTPQEMKYAVDNTVYVTVRNLQGLGDMLDSVVKAGANNIYGINFDVLDKTTAVNEARKMAIENAKANALDIASVAGVQLGKILSVNVYSSGGAVPMYDGKAYGGAQAATVPVSAGQMTITYSADLVYEIK